MNNHTLSAYDKQLAHLNHLILTMGGLVKQMLLLAGTALATPSPERVDEAKTMDKDINALDQQIEQQVTVVLALQNPMAVDLRFVTSALKIAASLERAGDLAKNIVKRSAKVQGAIAPRTQEKLQAITRAVMEMLEDALYAVEHRDPDKAMAVWHRDEEVDELYHQILSMMQEAMLSDPEHILDATHLVFAAKNFERIADYATTVAKTVHYVTSGKPADKSALRAYLSGDSNDAVH